MSMSLHGGERRVRIALHAILVKTGTTMELRSIELSSILLWYLSYDRDSDQWSIAPSPVATCSTASKLGVSTRFCSLVIFVSASQFLTLLFGVLLAI